MDGWMAPILVWVGDLYLGCPFMIFLSHLLQDTRDDAALYTCGLVLVACELLSHVDCKDFRQKQDFWKAKCECENPEDKSKKKKPRNRKMGNRKGSWEGRIGRKHVPQVG